MIRGASSLISGRLGRALGVGVFPCASSHSVRRLAFLLSFPVQNYLRRDASLIMPRLLNRGKRLYLHCRIV